MIKSMKRLLAVLLLLITLSFLPLTAIAQNIEQGDSIILTKDRVIDKDYFAAGNSVTLEGTVNGDAYLAGGNIVVTGTVNGDLLTAGGNIDVRGTVTGNIRAAGGNLNINGTVGRNVTLAGGSINIASTANITGSLTSAGGNINVASPIGKDANLAGGQITLSNRIGGDVNAATDKLSLVPQATVSGNLTYLSRNSASISQEATVSGRITQNIPPDQKPREEEAKRGVGALLSFFTLASFILAAIIGTLLIKFFPNFFDRTAGLIIRRPWASLGIGFLTAIVFPFAFLLLLITIIGIPVAMFLAFVLAVLLYLSKIFVAFVIGGLILQRFIKNTSRVWAFLFGLIIYYIVTIIPILGWIVSMIVGLIGLGAILISKKDFYKDLRAKEII